MLCFCYLRMSSLYMHREWVLFHKAHHVSTVAQKGQTLDQERGFFFIFSAIIGSPTKAKWRFVTMCNLTARCPLKYYAEWFAAYIFKWTSANMKSDSMFCAYFDLLAMIQSQFHLFQACYHSFCSASFRNEGFIWPQNMQILFLWYGCLEFEFTFMGQYILLQTQ